MDFPHLAFSRRFQLVSVTGQLFDDVTLLHEVVMETLVHLQEVACLVDVGAHVTM